MGNVDIFMNGDGMNFSRLLMEVGDKIEIKSNINTSSLLLNM